MSSKLALAFDAVHNEFLKFDRVENPLHKRRDLSAFLLLEQLVPGKGGPFLAAAEHDEVFLDVDCDALGKVATEADIMTLVRCGVRYSGEYHCLCMFV